MNVTRDILVENKILRLPVQNDAPKRRVRVRVGDAVVRSFEIELAEGEPDFWVSCDLAPFQGREAQIEIEGEDLDPALWAPIAQADALPDVDDLYREALRPQVHFSSRRGWNNDPNGLLYYRGRYHLFYQHNPYGVKWGNMHWGHAVSEDLVHWRELGDALYPDALGTAFSGCGVVDWENTAGLQDGEDPTLVCVYTAAGGTSPESADQPFTQCLFYSTDGGESWRTYAGNPVLGHIAAANRDPKVIWHAPSAQWVMALYLDESDFALYGSPDLKAWTRLCDVELPGCSECPDFFPLAVEGDPEDVRWLFWGANGTYLLGQFDGQSFVPDGPVQRYDWEGNAYAAQTWSDVPDGRRIQIAWLRVDPPGMPFGQQMTVPCELTLRRTPQGVRLCSMPVPEIAALYQESHRWQDVDLAEGENPLADLRGDLFDVWIEFEAEDPGTTMQLTCRGIGVSFDAAAGQLSCQGRTMPLRPVEGRVRLRALLDRVSLELWGNDGLVALALGVIPDEADRSLALSCAGGTTRVIDLQVHELRSAW